MGFRVFTALAAILLFAAAWSQSRAQGEGSAAEPAATGAAFTVGGIVLDVRADSVEEARDAAFREAPRRAWPRLWARMTGQSADSAPRMSDAALDAMIDAVEVEEERFGRERYIATLGIVFDRQRAGRRLPLGARLLQSSPVLLIPVLADAGTMTTFDPDSPWFEAWQEFGAGSSVIDYIRPGGSAGDNILLNAWQARRDDRTLWRAALERYDADNIVVAEARLTRSFPGGPVAGEFIARFGPDARELDRFTLRAEGAADVDDMLQTAVRRIDGLYAGALQDGLLQADSALSVALAPIAAAASEIDDGLSRANTITATVVTPTTEEWSAIEGILSVLPELPRYSLETLDIGGTSRVRLFYLGGVQPLRLALDRRGLRLEQGEAGFRLRRRIGSEAALPTVTVGIPDGAPPAPAAPAAPEIADPEQDPAIETPATAPPEAMPVRDEGPQSLLPDDDG
ncbi:MAG: hypothetical protein WA906_12395 [Pacificimonas sp.]